jgi:membrane protease YdiL (CAAX protease family)
VTSLYIGLGFLFRPDANSYLLLGIPITVVFQVFIARRPLRELWLRRGLAMQFDRWTALWLLLFLIGPIQAIVNGIRYGNWPVAIYGMAAIMGAVGAAFAFRVLGAANLRRLSLWFLLTIPIGIVLVLIRRSVPGVALHGLAFVPRLWTEVQSLLFYVPSVFVVEEVFFRGALDSYLHRDEQGTGWVSAAYVSVLWGLWHMPIVGSLSVKLVLALIVVQLFLGLILSWLWRKTGNLAMCGTLHAIIDSLRNALMA